MNYSVNLQIANCNVKRIFAISYYFAICKVSQSKLFLVKRHLK